MGGRSLQPLVYWTMMSLAPFVLGNQIFDFSRTYIMGIVNVTPDSFSDAGLFLDVDHALRHIEQLISDGADIIDIGAESTRPGAISISGDEECQRLEPLLKQYCRFFSVPLSLDTTKSSVAEMGLSYGVSMINDVSGLVYDSQMSRVIARAGAAVVVMHSQSEPVYADVVADVKLFLSKAVRVAVDAGITSIMIDPGIGFGKNGSHNLCLLRDLSQLTSLPYPILVGTSRKRFIGALTGEDVDQRLEGTLASVVIAAEHGAHFVRVHDVKAIKGALLVADGIRLS